MDLANLWRTNVPEVAGCWAERPAAARSKTNVRQRLRTNDTIDPPSNVAHWLDFIGIELGMVEKRLRSHDILYAGQVVPMKLLFVCSRNRRRSPTAEAVFSTLEGVESLSAGTSPDAETPISADLIEW